MAALYAAWFSALGTSLSNGEVDDISRYLLGLGLHATLPPRAVASWDEAAAIARTPADVWWRAEERARAALEAAVRVEPADPAWLALTDTLHGAAAVAAARAGCADEGLIRAAAGAAIYAAHQYRLARAAGARDDHPFVRKYALFAGGRWPLGLYGDRFAIF